MTNTAHKVHSHKRPSRVATIKAHDENGDLDVKISFSSTRLTRKEIDTVIHSAARLISSSFAGLPFVDYGIDNTKVKI